MADSVTIQPQPWSLIKGYRAYRFQGRINGGDIKGSIDFINKKIAPPYSLRMALRGIDLKSNQLMQGVTDRKLEGKIDGTLQYEAKNDSLHDGTGEADLVLSEGKAEITLPFLDQDSLEFDRLVIKCELKNSRLTLGQVEFKGPDLNAFLNGSIGLNRPFSKSRLNLKGEIEPLPEFFQRFSHNPSALELLRKRLKSGKLTFVVSGTLDDPTMRII